MHSLLLHTPLWLGMIPGSSQVCPSPTSGCPPTLVWHPQSCLLTFRSSLALCSCSSYTDGFTSLFHCSLLLLAVGCERLSHPTRPNETQPWHSYPLLKLRPKCLRYTNLSGCPQPLPSYLHAKKNSHFFCVY